jgi:membrane protease YdiL (CAAX protease family)
MGLVIVAIAVGVAFGHTNTAVIVGGVAELLLLLPAARFLASRYGDGDGDGDGDGARRKAFALGAASPLQLLIGASLGVLLHLPAGYLSELVERRFPTPPAALKAQLAALTPSSLPAAILMLLAIAVLVPFVEELFFRGALFTPLLRTGPALVAVWTTSLAFALAHAEPRNWAPLFLIALVLGELRRLGGSIWPGVALHAAFNAATLLFVFITRPVDVKPQGGSWQLASIGCVLCMLGVWVFGRVSGRRVAEAGST